MAFRIFSVLAAALLVGAVALGTLAPPDMTLAQGLALVDAESYAHCQQAIQAQLGLGVWNDVIAPFLVRPLWLVPVFLGLICVGVAVSSLRAPSPHKKHRRS